MAATLVEPARTVLPANIVQREEPVVYASPGLLFQVRDPEKQMDKRMEAAPESPFLHQGNVLQPPEKEPGVPAMQGPAAIAGSMAVE